MPGLIRLRLATVTVAALALSAIALLATPRPAAAADGSAPDLLNDPFSIALGTYVVATNTKVKVNGELIGDVIDLENKFGVADKNRFRLDAYWRFADRHKLRFLWFDWSATRTKKIKEDFVFDDIEFEVDATAKLSNRFSVYELAYEYAFLRREDFELAGSIGVHYTELSVEIEGKLDVNGEPIGKGEAKGDASVGAPLPVIGLRGQWNFAGDFWLDGSAQFFTLSWGDYDGNLQDYRIGLTWQPKKWLGIGIGYNAFDVNVDLKKDRFDGSLDWTYYGPMIYYSATF